MAVDFYYFRSKINLTKCLYKIQPGGLKMKKQILALSMCIALSSATVLAASSKAPIKPSKQGCPIEKPCDKKPLPPKMSREEAKQKFEEHMAQKRESFYKELCLTPEQKAKAEALDAKTKAEVKPLMKKVGEEQMKLRDLIDKKACAADIKAQKAAVRAARKDVNAKMKAHKDAFKALLTCEQQKKYDELKAKKRAEHKKFESEHKKGCKCPKCGPHHKHMGPPPMERPEE